MQRTNAENAKLRDGYGSQSREHTQTVIELSDAYDKIDQLKAENAKLRELVARMAEALGIDCEWADPDWCKSPCVLEFGCRPEGDHTEIRCPAWAAMRELGVEVSE